jgi:hypothetical protein
MCLWCQIAGKLLRVHECAACACGRAHARHADASTGRAGWHPSHTKGAVRASPTAIALPLSHLPYPYANCEGRVVQIHRHYVVFCIIRLQSASKHLNRCEARLASESPGDPSGSPKTQNAALHLAPGHEAAAIIFHHRIAVCQGPTEGPGGRAARPGRSAWPGRDDETLPRGYVARVLYNSFLSSSPKAAVQAWLACAQQKASRPRVRLLVQVWGRSSMGCMRLVNGAVERA